MSTVVATDDPPGRRGRGDHGLGADTPRRDVEAAFAAEAQADLHPVEGGLHGVPIAGPVEFDH
ncbi:hypothetical protein [Amycolatopsis sp. NPDC049868]|uniref:hypothetical protein n=1 Tax=Amycolatopsis sp. NPDC049868 TaxID=3363934 RepID=UPI00378896B2